MNASFPSGRKVYALSIPAVGKHHLFLQWGDNSEYAKLCTGVGGQGPGQSLNCLAFLLAAYVLCQAPSTPVQSHLVCLPQNFSRHYIFKFHDSLFVQGGSGS